METISSESRAMRTKKWRVWYKRGLGLPTSRGFDTRDEVVKFIAKLLTNKDPLFDIKYNGRIISAETCLDILRKAKTLNRKTINPN